MKVLFLILLLGILGWMVHERQFESAVLKKAGRVNESNLPPDSEIIATTALSPEPPPSPRPRGRIASGVAGYKYLSYEPPAYQTTNGTWPLIIFLHGACPDDRLEKLKYFGPIKYGLSHVDFPFLVVAPATSNGWHLPHFTSYETEITPTGSNGSVCGKFQINGYSLIPSKSRMCCCCSVG